MATLYTPVVEGQPNRSATFNAALDSMEASILARAGTIVTRQRWTTMAVADTKIVIDVVAGDNTLQLMLALRTDRAGASDDAIRITFNDDTSSTYISRYARIDSSVTAVSNSGTTGFQLDYAATGATATAGTYGYVRLTIPLASSSSARGMNYETVALPTTSGGTMKFCVGTGFYPTSAVISRLRIVPVNGTNFVAGSQYALYGMA